MAQPTQDPTPPDTAAQQSIRMSPEEEQAALADPGEGVEPADEGVGVFTDRDDDDYTTN